MHPNPNKFLTVLFSFIPGAGHMYLGLMRRGISLMLGFALSIFGAAYFSMHPYIRLLLYLFGMFIPVMWFIAFFDFWRYPRMSPEEKAQVTDEFLIPKGVKLPGGAAMRKARVAGGILLILAGAFQLYQTVFQRMVYDYLHSQRVIAFFDNMPTLLTALGIIAIGLLLIFWKSRQIKREASDEE